MNIPKVEAVRMYTQSDYRGPKPTDGWTAFFTWYIYVTFETAEYRLLKKFSGRVVKKDGVMCGEDGDEQAAKALASDIQAHLERGGCLNYDRWEEVRTDAFDWSDHYFLLPGEQSSNPF